MSLAAGGPAMLWGSVPSSAVTRPGVHVYLLKGLLGLSPGLVDLADKLKRRGINATVHAYGEASALADEAAAKYKSGQERQIVVIGHSSGGTAALEMAEELGRAHVPVALVVPIDAPRTPAVPSNVRRVINLYISNGVGVAVERGKKFHGRLKNMDMKNDPEMGHFAIQSSEKVHKQLIGYVLAAIGGHPAAHHKQATLR